MNLRALLKKLEETKELLVEKQEISLKQEITKHIHGKKEFPTIFENLKESDWRVLSGVCSQRKYLAIGLEIPVEKILFALSEAFENPTTPEIVEKAACQENVIYDFDLRKLPIPHFFERDGGPYISAGVMIVKDPETGLNASYHRTMVTGEKTFTLRLVEKRQTHTAFVKSGGKLEAAMCLGNSQAVMLASSMSPADNVFELDIANTLDKTPLVKCKSKDLLVPADCEIVLEGYITNKMVSEGPFVDLTGTYDFIRQQPTFEVDCITYKNNPMFQVLLPGQREHKLLMGMPKEPSIFSYVNKEVKCKNVVLTNGGGCWLHAVVQIEKVHKDDGKKAIELAFKAHKSLKHVIVIDEDIDIYDGDMIEWALATRFQADKDLIVLEKQPSSSLDPSALHIPGEKSKTAKLGFDATTPFDKDKEEFSMVKV